jgi:hypothetical protein
VGLSPTSKYGEVAASTARYRVVDFIVWSRACLLVGRHGVRQKGFLEICVVSPISRLP